MGAWSHTPFGNDSALDWAAELAESADCSVIEAALDRVLDTGTDYVDASDGEEAIAAIEVLAQMIGRGTEPDALPSDVKAWVAAQDVRPAPALLEKARLAAERLAGGDSELAELWDDSDSADAWRESLAQLQRAVAAG